MARRSAYPQTSPRDSLLTHVDAHVRLLTRAAVQPAVLRKYIVGPNRVGFVVSHPAHAVRATRLFVGHREVDQVALRAEAGGGEMAEGDRHRCRQVQHVNRATAPHFWARRAVDELTTERILRPACSVHGHDVGVPHQAQTRRGRVAAFNASDQRLTLRAGT